MWTIMCWAEGCITGILRMDYQVAYITVPGLEPDPKQFTLMSLLKNPRDGLSFNLLNKGVQES